MNNYFFQLHIFMLIFDECNGVVDKLKTNASLNFCCICDKFQNKTTFGSNLHHRINC